MWPPGSSNISKFLQLFYKGKTVLDLCQFWWDLDLDVAQESKKKRPLKGNFAFGNFCFAQLIACEVGQSLNFWNFSTKNWFLWRHRMTSYFFAFLKSGKVSPYGKKQPKFDPYWENGSRLIASLSLHYSVDIIYKKASGRNILKCFFSLTMYVYLNIHIMYIWDVWQRSKTNLSSTLEFRVNIYLHSSSW